MKVYGIIAVAVVLLCGAASSTAAVYKWIDSEGNVHFGDKPPVEEISESVDIKVNSYTPSPISAEAATEKEPGAKKEVIMYGAEWCGVCKQAERYFKKNKIPYKEYDIEKSRKGKRDYKKMNGRGVPIIMVDGQRMNGFTPARFKALYDK